MAGLFKKIGDIKESVVDSFQERKNIKTLESNGVIITDFRICNGAKQDLYVSAHVDVNEKKLYFASQRTIENGAILVDKLLNLYQVKASTYGKNKLFNEDVITTICDYESFVPNNPARNVISQSTSVMQGFSDNSFSNIGTLVLNVEQKATIEQSISVNQMAETVEDEAKYRYDPVKNISSFLELVNKILKGLETIDKLEDKLAQSVLKETSSFLKDMILMLIKNIKNKADETGHCKE